MPGNHRAITNGLSSSVSFWRMLLPLSMVETLKNDVKPWARSVTHALRHSAPSDLTSRPNRHYRGALGTDAAVKYVSPTLRWVQLTRFALDHHSSDHYMYVMTCLRFRLELFHGSPIEAPRLFFNSEHMPRLAGQRARRCGQGKVGRHVRVTTTQSHLPRIHPFRSPTYWRVHVAKRTPRYTELVCKYVCIEGPTSRADYYRV